MYFNRNLFIGILILVSAIFVGCADTEAIFASIEKEEKIETGNLDDQVTGIGMAQIGDNYLLATGGAIFYRGISDKDWNTLELPDDFDGASKLIETKRGEQAFAVLVKGFSKFTPDEFAMFEVTPAGAVAELTKVHSAGTDFLDIFAVSDTVGITQTGTSTTGINIFAVVGNFSVSSTNSAKYYQHYETNTPQLLELDNTTTSYVGVSTTEHSATIIDVAYDGINNQYYLANESSVYKVVGNKLELITPSPSSPLGYIGGIYFTPKDANTQVPQRLYVSSGRYADVGGYVRTYDPTSNTWADSGKKTSRFFTKFTYIEQVRFTGILVGTAYKRQTFGRDEGYFEMENGQLSLDKPTGNKYTSGKLDTAGIMGFYVGENIFFVMTKAVGVWQGNYNNSTSVDWYLE